MQQSAATDHRESGGSLRTSRMRRSPDAPIDSEGLDSNRNRADDPFGVNRQLCHLRSGNGTVKTLIAIGVISASAAFLPDPAKAHERAGDAALGAIARAVVA